MASSARRPGRAESGCAGRDSTVDAENVQSANHRRHSSGSIRPGGRA
jgi:hypothetical protein